MDIIEQQVCNETKAALYINPNFLRRSTMCSGINKSSEIQNVDLNEFSLSDLRYNWALIRLFNRYISDCINLINLSQHNLLPPGSISLSLSSSIASVRNLLAMPVKLEMQ
mmetsp:Transcript_6325/g.805  ORF Transcript_6325/g.805 Transcript_6325/m.805 type:complete len:110 (+) Transcript_6325:9132-9461(+)